MNGLNQVVKAVLEGSRKATRYVSPMTVVKATARHRPRMRSRTVEIVVTIGRPNYAERAFIRQAKKAGEPFPVRKIQVKPWGSNKR